MSWQEYVRRHASGRSQAALAALVDVSQTAVSRWLKGAQGVDAGVAIRFARAVGDEPLTALIEAGYLTREEAGAAPAARPDFSQLSNDELLELVRGRMRDEKAGGEHADRSAPRSQAGPEPANNVHALTPPDQGTPPPPADVAARDEQDDDADDHWWEAGPRAAREGVDDRPGHGNAGEESQLGPEDDE